jgi:hypothetical protein
MRNQRSPEDALTIEQIVNLPIEREMLDPHMLHHFQVGDLLEALFRDVAVIEALDLRSLTEASLGTSLLANCFDNDGSRNAT